MSQAQRTLDPYDNRDLAPARARRRRYDPAAHNAAREALQRRAAIVRDRVTIKDAVEKVVGKMKKAGRAFIAPCPFHADSTASLAVYPEPGDRVPVPFFVCYGCGIKGDVIKFVMERQKLDWRQAIELLEGENGLRLLTEATPPPPAPKVAQVLDRKKLERAELIWERAQVLAPGGVVDLYLRGRAIVPPASYGAGDAAVNGGWPPDIRFSGRCWHYLEKKHFPAMVAAIRGYGDALLTVHCTFLASRQDGSWVKAPIEKPKLVVGSYGPGFIRLGPDADAMLGGEGIESSLSAMQLWKRSGLAFVTSGRMKSVEPPFACSDFVYAADKGGGNNTRWGEVFAHEGAKKFGVGRKMAVQIPNIDADKADFNDYVVTKASGTWRPASALPVVSATPSVPPVRGPLSPPCLPSRPMSARAGRDEPEATAARLEEVGKGERLARQRYIQAQEALSRIDRTNDEALSAARAEVDSARTTWNSALKGRRVA